MDNVPMAMALEAVQLSDAISAKNLMACDVAIPPFFLSDEDYQSNLNLIGASLGITLDGKLVRSKNDVLGDFLHEINRTGISPPSS
ncbi:hypothetical protein Tco_0098002 [Tanacetum coccineum]